MRNRKEEIIYATLELAAEYGLGSVSMQQIAEKVGITKASLYNHFSSRDEIVNAMYEVLRDASKQRLQSGPPDYDRLTPEVPLEVILTGAVSGYRDMVKDPEMFRFYKVIMSERSVHPAAAEIMVKETETMITATKTLFYALQVKGIASFENVDAAAFSFAMAVHAIIDYECDLLQAGGERGQAAGAGTDRKNVDETGTDRKEADDAGTDRTNVYGAGTDRKQAAGAGTDRMKEFIHEFCRIYQA